MRRVVDIDGAAHEVLLQHLVEARDRCDGYLERIALVHGLGRTGALFAGYPSVTRLRCPWQTFAEPEAALEWLGVEVKLRPELIELGESLLHDSVERVRLGVYLGERPTASLYEAARALAIAPRTLQRSLERQGTSFRRELDHARWTRAVEALGAGHGSITQVAHACGFGSLQAFSSWFRARAGRSPRAFRTSPAGPR